MKISERQPILIKKNVSGFKHQIFVTGWAEMPVKEFLTITPQFVKIAHMFYTLTTEMSW